MIMAEALPEPHFRNIGIAWRPQIPGGYSTLSMRGIMKRRKFIGLLGSAAIVVKPTRVFPQTTGKLRKVAVLLVSTADDAESGTLVSAFEQGMRAAGWTKDVNVHLDYRWGGTDPQHAASAAAEVAALKPDVVVAIGSPVVVAMQRLTATIPIVFAIVSDPVGQGVVTTLAHPGGNLTGFSNLEPGIGGRWLQLLKELAPNSSRIVVMFNPATSPYNELFLRSVEDAVSSFHVEVARAPVMDDRDIAAAFERLASSPDVGLLVPSDAFTYFRSGAIVALAAKYQLPAIYAFRRFVTEGGLVSYGVDAFDQVRSSASYVDLILKGAKPHDLPVQMPTKYTLIINLKTAKALNLTVPPTLLALADETIE
jgi:putative ABC transport system substrate-binding protein